MLTLDGPSEPLREKYSVTRIVSLTLDTLTRIVVITGHKNAYLEGSKGLIFKDLLVRVHFSLHTKSRTSDRRNVL